MNNKRVIARITAAALAVLMLAGACAQLFSVTASAADSITSYSNLSIRRNGSKIDYIGPEYKVDISFDIVAVVDFGSDPPSKTFYTNRTQDDFSTNMSVWRKTTSGSGSSQSSLKIEPIDKTGNPLKPDEWNLAITVTNLTYRSNDQDNDLRISAKIELDNSEYFEYDINIQLSSAYFTRGESSSGGDDYEEETFTSDIVIESIFARDKEGAIIREVTKDTAPFTLDIVYTDRGFKAEHIDEFTDDTLFAYLTDAGDFIPQGTNRGTLKRTASSDGDPPRFRVSFENLKYAGTSANFAKIDFRVQYLVYGQDIAGTGSGRLYAIKPDEDDDEDETAPPTPYIIISQYDLGSEQIEAGSIFTLALSFANTSSDISLENIMMVINPVSTEQQESYLSIASSTNTYYYNGLGAGGGLSQSVDILVKGTATVGSQAVTVDFKYEYIVDKKRESGSTSTTIYIPITQIDRFAVDPITDYSSYMELGQEGYATVSFVNQGKSTTYNVSGYLLDSEGNQAQTEHFGNLEAGANGSLDFSIYPDMAGDYTGNIIIRYEDENGEEKEIPVSFTAFVEEPYYPQPIDPGEIDPGMMEQEPGTPWWKYLMFVGGAFAIALPIALYLYHRVAAKGKEEFDEDF